MDSAARPGAPAADYRDTRIVELSPHDATLWLPAALEIYVTAMDYPRGTETHRAPMWREHLGRDGFAAFGAITALPTPEGAVDHLVGIAYGYSGERDQWWNHQLRLGLRQRGYGARQVDELSARYFELTELHVHPSAQGHGIGSRLLHALLTDRPEPRVLLSTPEVPGEENRAWRLYRRCGFTDVLRDFRFSGDPRPFAVLGRTLPLASRPASARSAAPQPGPAG
ncbi:N-acetyltransferase [Tsukamurella sp. 8F]|uniref:GNAT family N-acetyltransferase n=1 Tax=unclassified Tsukamurella TaxID=2633480 RepID=UPI0023B88AF3|nr:MULTISPECIES: N-acetyltransferase [unclassified Tsukamurella]MDF0532029.1 N-acetyltransferase [Tsukamurella sp. 8J]MDF0588434.1 N-acetyltransferase [Tsukamurella sp. 8F]